MFLLTDEEDGVDKEDEDIFFLNRSGGYMSFGLILDVIDKIERLLEGSIYFPYLIMEAVIIIIIKFFVFSHPICKLFEFKSSMIDIYAVLFENCPCELLYYMMNTCSFHFHIIVPNF